ncbi:MAG: hypothetical protein HQK92_06840 [Nitrospirae bacterium]|nr:hypothetical protein [Nitrospirota bacterium]
MAKKVLTPVTKKVFFMCVSEDVDHPIRWSLKNDFKSLITLKAYKGVKDLKRALEADPCNYLIVDSLVFDPILKHTEEIFAKYPFLKILVVLPPELTAVEVKSIKESASVTDVIIRPFTPESLYAVLYDSFGFKKPKEVNIFGLKKGMVVADNIFSQSGSEPLVECGVVLDDALIETLKKHNIKKVNVHDDMTKLLNCWEYQKCGFSGQCPASIFVDADGYLGGVCAGRGCMFVKDTILNNELIKGKNFVEKVTLMCSKCEFCKIVATDSKGAVSHSNFVEHIKNNKADKRNENPLIEKPKIN